jgi:hypothetical protein
MRSKRLVSPFGSPAETGGVGAEEDDSGVMFVVGHERAEPETQRRECDPVVTSASSFCRRRRRAKYAAVAGRAASINAATPCKHNVDHTIGLLIKKMAISFLRIWGSVYHPRYDFKTMDHVLNTAIALQVFQHGRVVS